MFFIQRHMLYNRHSNPIPAPIISSPGKSPSHNGLELTYQKYRTIMPMSPNKQKPNRISFPVLASKLPDVVLERSDLND